MAVLRWLWRKRRGRPWLVAVAGVTALALLSYPVVDALLRGHGVAPEFVYWDFGAYGAAVNRWHAGEPLYVAENGDYHGSYLYPPVVLLLFAPFTLLPYPMPAVAWGLFSASLLWLGCLALVRAAGYAPPRHEAVLLGLALAGFQPLLLSAKLGQTAGFLGALLAFGGTVAVADDEAQLRAAGGHTARLSGALTALAGLVKLPYAPASAHLLGDRRRLLGGVAAGAGLVALSLAVFGVGPNLTYLEVLAWGAGGDARPPVLWLPPYYKPLYAVHHLLGSGSTLAVRLLLAVGIAGLAVRNEGDDAAVFALGVAAVPLLAPRTYTYYLVALVPAALALLPGELRRTEGDGRTGGGLPWLPVLALLLAQVHSYGLKLLLAVVSEWWLLGLLQPGLWGNLLLVGLAGWRVAVE